MVDKWYEEHLLFFHNDDINNIEIIRYVHNCSDDLTPHAWYERLLRTMDIVQLKFSIEWWVFREKYKYISIFSS